MREYGDQVVAALTDADRWMHWSFIALRIVLIFIVARVAIKVLGKAVRHFAEDRERLRFNPRRSATIIKLMGNLVKYVINFVMVLMILGELGVPYGPILAGAGVFGLAIGFGAQSLVKDVITGFFILFEDQFAIGDVVQIGSYKGTVEEIGLRVTRIRSWTGEVHIVPNGSIANVTNFSQKNSLAVIDLSLAYDTDIDQACGWIREALSAARQGNKTIVKDPEVLGLQTIGGGAVVVRVACECRPDKEYETVRWLNEEIKRALDKREVIIVSSVRVTS